MELHSSIVVVVRSCQSWSQNRTLKIVEYQSEGPLVHFDVGMLQYRSESAEVIGYM